MPAHIIDGQAIAQIHYQRLHLAITQAKPARMPGLAVILVGENPASQLYVSKKIQACERLGFYSEIITLSNDVTTEKLLAEISKLNHHDYIDGILVQLPLPGHIATQAVLESILPTKDVDGFHPFNIGKLVQNQALLRPCTPYGIITLLEHIGCSLKGKQVCVVGASQIVGRPMALELINHHATVTLCHIYTQDLVQHLQCADIAIIAIGQPEFIQGSWFKKEAIVIDVGVNKLSSGKIVGDVNFSQALEQVAYITPVPGGVGPMTVCMLLQNTFTAWQLHQGLIKG